eukprot:2754680-Rhodomonas_salina.1
MSGLPALCLMSGLPVCPPLRLPCCHPSASELSHPLPLSCTLTSSSHFLTLFPPLPPSLSPSLPLSLSPRRSLAFLFPPPLCPCRSHPGAGDPDEHDDATRVGAGRGARSCPLHVQP